MESRKAREECTMLKEKCYRREDGERDCMKGRNLRRLNDCGRTVCMTF